MSAVPSTALTRLDLALLRQTRERLGQTPAVPVARVLSHFGEHALGWLSVGSVGWLTGRHREEWSTAIVGIVAAHATGVAVKRVVRRPRPALDDVPALVRTAGWLSFPSAHSCSTAAAAVGFSPLLGTPVMAGALSAMLVSRVLLGVHYPSDVAAGAAIGGFVAVGVRQLRSRAGRKVRS